MHKLFGYVLYVSSKLLIFAGWYIWNGPGWVPLLSIVILYNVCFFAFKFMYLERKYVEQDPAIYVADPYDQTPLNVGTYHSIIELIQRGANKHMIRSEYPDVKYALFKNELVDLSGITHPGGQYILERVVGEEISRYIFGAYNIEDTAIESHQHTIYALNMLSERRIGTISIAQYRLLVPKTGEVTNVPTPWTLSKNEKITLDTNLL